MVVLSMNGFKQFRWFERGDFTIFTKKSLSCLVALENHQIIEVILVGLDGRRAYIYNTAVHPGYRRKGIAKQLVETVLKVLDEPNIHKLALVVFKDNRIGNQFWKKTRLFRSRSSSFPQSNTDWNDSNRHIVYKIRTS